MKLSLEEFEVEALRISLLPSGLIALDFETTGLSAYKGARAFVIGWADGSVNRCYFFGQDVEREKKAVQLFVSNPAVRYCSHNSKFESSFLHVQFEAEIKGPIVDTEVNARIEYNNHMSYSLQNCALRIGMSKYPPMLEWLKQRGNKSRYHEAPEELIIPYVERDAYLSLILAEKQFEVFHHWDVSSPIKIKNVVMLERMVLPHLFEMEKNGLLVDVNYCRKALEYEDVQLRLAADSFKSKTGAEFVDSRKTLKPIFDSHGINYGETALGNASFTEDALSGSKDHPVVAEVMRYRRAKKRSSAYWSNFLELEHNGIIHPSINQNRAQTGRMSISDPSCQNWSTDEDDGTSFPIRRAFIARPDCVIASLDYSQMELRKGADEAEDHPMIERILGGADLHQEVADQAGVPRSLAKNGRFAKQYGAGVPRIAETLGVSEALARTISDLIDKQAAAMTAYSFSLSRAARHTFGTDWLGRRFYFDRGFEYKAFNYRIQGGCAEILKIAIIEVATFLKKNARPETFLILPVHDELIANVHKDDLWVLPEIKRLMIAAHRDKKFLGMDVNIEIGPNLYDLEKYIH